MPRLRTVSPQLPRWSRRRAGRGFSYLGVDGQRLADADGERCRRLVVPPAWEGAWICPYPNGHIQATGTHAAGRAPARKRAVARAVLRLLKAPPQNRVRSRYALATAG